MPDTRAKLLHSAAELLRTSTIGEASARTIAVHAEVNQALIFYHFGTVSELLAAASRDAVDDAVGHYREQFASVTTLRELLAVGRELHERERHIGNVAMMAQLMSAASRDPVLAGAARYAMRLWSSEIEAVIGRVLRKSPLAAITDSSGLAGAVAASFIGLELYDAVDADAVGLALDALERLGVLVEVVDDLGPVARRALKSKLRTIKSAR
jgi:AcrR family transcriptional regulator